MNPSTDTDLRPSIAAEFLALAELLDDLPAAAWDTPSLCAGWRVREVVAHVTLPVRYSPAEFMAELQACDGDFTRLSNLLASRDALLAKDLLVTHLRADALHAWTPPGGGQMGALTHVVIHGLDITLPLGVPRRSPDDTIRRVLDDLTVGGTHVHFGVELDGRSLRASDLDWSYGSGPPTTAPAAELAAMLCGRELVSSPEPPHGAASG